MLYKKPLFLLLKTNFYMKIAIGSDHAGFLFKEKIKALLTDKNIDIEDFGAFSTNSVDYPDFAHPVAESVNQQQADFGILLCGSGNGIAMAANKHSNIRAAIAWLPELASLARQHNNANVLVIPARFITEQALAEIVNAFFNTDFEGGRHTTRVNKISC